VREAEHITVSERFDYGQEPVFAEERLGFRSIVPGVEPIGFLGDFYSSLGGHLFDFDASDGREELEQGGWFSWMSLHPGVDPD
jgi:hypothetical protein